MAMNIKGITIKIGADTHELTKELNKIKREVSGIDSLMGRLKASMNRLGSATPFSSVAKQQELLATKIKNLNKQLNEQQYVYKNLDKSTSDYAAKSQALATEIEITKNKIQALSNQFITTDKSVLKTIYNLDRASVSMNKVAEATKYFSLASGATLAGAVAAAVSFEDAWAGVLKTVEGTPEELAAVNQGLKELATNTSSSYEDIAHFAELAGQMGIATESVVGFTETIVKLNDTTNLLGEEAAQSIAKFANVMADKSEQTNEYFSRLGSTIVDLGNNFATTEKDIMLMATRLATAGRQVGFSSSQVLGLATALSSMGIEAQAGGGSISKMLKQIEVAVATGNESLQSFAEVSNMTVDEFVQAWENDAANAFLHFVEGIGKTENISKTLDELGIKEIRMSQAMGALAQNSELLASALGTADRAWESNTAMTIEAEKRYNTLKSSLLQAWEAIKQAGNELGQALTPTIKSVADGVKELALGFANLDDGTQEFIAKSLVLVTSIAPLAKLFSVSANGLSHLVQAAVKGRSSLTSLSTAMGLTAKTSEIGEVSILGFGKALLTAHPGLLAVGAACGTFAIAIKKAHDAQVQLTQSVRESLETNNLAYMTAKKLTDGYESYKTTIDSLNKSNDDLVTGLKANSIEADNLMKIITKLNEKESLNSAQKAILAESVQKLNSIYPELNLAIDGNTGKLKTGTDATYASIDAINERINALKQQAEEEANAALLSNTVEALAQTTAQYESQKQTISDLSAEKQRLSEQMLQEVNVSSETSTAYSLVCQKLLELEAQYASTSSALVQLTADQLYYENYLETKDYSVLGEGLKTQLVSMVDSAKESGWKIPQVLSEGIQNPESIGSVNLACQLLASMTTFQGLIDQSKMFGGLISPTIANEIIQGAGSVQGAVDTINKLIKFVEGIKQAEAEGKQITAATARGIAKDAGFVGDSAKKLGDEAAKNFKKKADKMPKDAKKTDESIAKAFSSGSAPAAVSAYGNSMHSKLKGSLDKMVADANSSASQIKSTIQSAQSYANNNPIIITRKTVTKQEKQRMMMADMLRDTEQATEQYATPYVGSTHEVQTTVISDYVMGSSQRNYERSDKGIARLSNKIDKLISSFSDMQLMIQLQPQVLDGDVITDKVTEIMSIRNMLELAGKGEY